MYHTLASSGARKVSGKATGGYLHQRRQGWYLAVTVPPSARSALGKPRLIRSLETRDKKEAERRRFGAFARMRAEIAAAIRGSAPPNLMTEALTLRDQF